MSLKSDQLEILLGVYVSKNEFNNLPSALIDMVTEVGDADIRRRHKVGSARTSYILSNKYNRIQRSGEITAWRFYSNHGGEVALQVWRQIGNTMQ